MSLFPGLNYNNQTPNNDGNNILFSARVKDILLSNEQKIFTKIGGWASLGTIQFKPLFSTIDSNTYCLSSDSRLSDNRTPVAHQLDSATYHTISGKTTGHFLKATSATTFAFVAHGLTPNDVIIAFDDESITGTYNWDVSTKPNIYDTTLATGAVTINVSVMSDGMSGMCDFKTQGSATTLTLSTTVSGCTKYVDSSANLTLSTNTEYFLTVVRANNKIKFNLAKYV